AAHWSWSGRPAGPPPPTATFNGVAVPLTTLAGITTVTVTGDGTLAFAGGGELTIARGLPSAQATIKLR
ncbi:MAG: hypothetical protein M3680_35150, partial [Myxococcota bacterium]|nr:hypothetical protein [Myxococcota bacterium]